MSHNFLYSIINLMQQLQNIYNIQNTANIMRFISKMNVQAPIESIYAQKYNHVDLTPWDLQLLLVGPIQEGFIFHKPQNSSSTSALIRHLAASLSQTLLFFPPLAGRLSMTQNDDDATASFSIDCNNAGALFFHATAADSLSVSDVLDAVYVPPAVSSFFPLNGDANIDGVTQPLLAVQVTELAGDSLFVGCTINHVAADGTSFWHFLKSWSEISRGLGAISKPPSLRRWFPVDINCPIRIPLEELRKKHVQLNHDDDMGSQPMLERVYRFSEGKIKELKAEANSEMCSDRISSLQALLAYFWRCVVRSQRLERDEDVYFVLAIGARSRVHQPPLPEEYLGNAVHVGRMKMKAGELVEHGIGHAAWEMNKIVGMHTQDMIKNSLKSWSENPTLIPMSTKCTRINAVAATNSPRFKVYDTDFGWGRPIAVRNGAGNKVPGKVVLYPGGPEEADGIEIHACFFPQVFHALEKDYEFMNKAVIN